MPSTDLPPLFVNPPRHLFITVLFWACVACHNCVLDIYEHPDDRRARRQREKKERQAAARKLEEEKVQLKAQKKIEKKRELERRKSIKRERRASVAALNNYHLFLGEKRDRNEITERALKRRMRERLEMFSNAGDDEDED